MRQEQSDSVLSHIDSLLDELGPVMCWRCEAARGEPSMCRKCIMEHGHEKAPRNLKRLPWVEPV